MCPKSDRSIFETRRLTEEIDDTKARVEALRPAFAKLLASDGWLPKEYGEPDLKSGMGGGIGQYALYRAENGSLCLFSLVIPAGAADADSRSPRVGTDRRLSRRPG